MNLQSKYKIDRDESHAYTVEYKGKITVLPGVTGILDIVGSKDKVNRLMGWAKKNCLLKVAEHIRAFSGKSLIVDETWIEAVRKSAWKRDKEMLKEAGDIGTRVHNAIDSFIKGEEPLLDPDTKQGFDNFLAWLKESRIKLIQGDTYIASLKMGYGGAMDALGEIDGKLVLLDWKTSNYIQENYSLQAAAYTMAFEECFEQDIDKAFVVRFGKEKSGDIEPKEVNLLNATKAFKSALDLKDMMSRPVWMEDIKCPI
jgi:hypothetical protein